MLFIALLLAAAPLDEDPAFIAGQGFYQQLEFEKAAFRFRAAAQAPDRTPDDAARAWAWLGVACVQAGDDACAGDAFLAGVRQRPDLTLPVVAPQRASDLLAAAKERRDASIARDDRAIEPPPPARMSMPSPWLLAGGGALIGAAVGLGAGAVVAGLHAGAAVADAEATPWFGEASAKYDDAEASAVAANGLWIAAGLAGAAGIAAAAAAWAVPE